MDTALPKHEDFELLATLEDGYDERTAIAPLPGGGLIVVHPDKPARFLPPGGVLEDIPMPDFNTPTAPDTAPR